MSDKAQVSEVDNGLLAVGANAPDAAACVPGVLKFKREAEKVLEGSGLPYTIVRPNRLTDGPYTSYDVNTLLKATAGNRQDVQVSLKDDLLGEMSRISTAGAKPLAAGSPGLDMLVSSLCWSGQPERDTGDSSTAGLYLQESLGKLSELAATCPNLETAVVQRIASCCHAGIWHSVTLHCIVIATTFFVAGTSP
jgi:NAD(P)H-binding